MVPFLLIISQTQRRKFAINKILLNIWARDQNLVWSTLNTPLWGSYGLNPGVATNLCRAVTKSSGQWSSACPSTKRASAENTWSMSSWLCPDWRQLSSPVRIRLETHRAANHLHAVLCFNSFEELSACSFTWLDLSSKSGQRSQIKLTAWDRMSMLQLESCWIAGSDTYRRNP